MEETEIMMEITVEYATFLPLGRYSKHVWAMGWVVCGVWYGPRNSDNKRSSVEPTQGLYGPMLPGWARQGLSRCFSLSLFF